MKLFLIPLLLFSVSASASPLPELKPERHAVKLPRDLRESFLENMRDHLSAVSEIQAALAEKNFDKAAEIAKNRLGLDAPSSAACRPGMEMADLAKFMPENIRAVGFKMHSAADQFAVDAKNAGTDSDYRAVIDSLSKVTRQCVSCHTQYRLANR